MQVNDCCDESLDDPRRLHGDSLWRIRAITGMGSPKRERAYYRMTLMGHHMRSIIFGLSSAAGAALLIGLASIFDADARTGGVPVIVAFAVAMAVLHYWKTLHFQAMREGFHHLSNRLALLHDHVSEAQGLVQLCRFNDPYPLPFGGGWALAADAAVVLVREIALSRPGTIVELGSGVSTLLIGRMLKEAGQGRLYSLDHDAHWADQTRCHVRASGLEDYVQVLDAPLTKQRFGGEEYLWYQVPPEVRQAAEIDLLVVDGPPQAIDPEGLPRYPALPAFHAQFSSQAVIYVDDAGRPPETEMVQRWLREYPEFTSQIHDTVPGTRLLRRSP